jgi:integrase
LTRTSNSSGPTSISTRGGSSVGRPTWEQRKDTRPEIAAALPDLQRIAGDDPRLLPWNHHKRTLYVEFYRIQRAAGIHLVCPKAGEKGHECNETCHTYGFHAFRYAHARLNYEPSQLQNQMGHASAATTEHYKRWAAREVVEYGAYSPEKLAEREEPPERRKNSGKDDGKPRVRLLTA